MASLQSKGWTFSRDCMAVSFELSSNQSGFPHFSILYRWWKILHDLVLWVHLMMLLANVTHLRLSLSTTAISMWPKEAQGSAKRNVPTRRRASIFGSLAEDQQFLMIEGSGVSFVDIFKMPEAHRNSFSGWDGWNRYIVWQTSDERKIVDGFDHFQSTSPTTGWLASVDFGCDSPGPLILFHHLVGVFQVHRWVGLMSFSDMFTWLVTCVSCLWLGNLLPDYPD